jgi:glycerophosphoryl diester phosphodiesterase
MPPPDHPWFRLTRPIDRPLVFAHRGGAGLRPENTLAAFEHAAGLGVQGMELDLRLSRDGVPVVIHDADLARTTSATVPVAALTADELANVDAGYHFAPAEGHPWRGRGAGVPRFRDVLRLVPSMPLIVELKGVSLELARAAVRVAAEERAIDRICFAGFSADTLAAARSTGFDIGTSATSAEVRLALYKSYVGWPLGRRPYGAFQVPERANDTVLVTPRFVRHVHRAGMLVQVWTINEEADMRRLVAWGVDGLITDRPDRALAVLGAPTPGRHRLREPASK